MGRKSGRPGCLVSGQVHRQDDGSPGMEQAGKGHRGRQGSQAGLLALDRLGRTAKGLTALFEDLVTRKVNLVSLKDGLDLSTPAGRLMANVLASVAAYETEVRSEQRPRRSGSGPGRRQAHGKARRNPDPRQGDSGARHPGSTDEDRGGTNRQHCPGNRTVPSHNLSGSRSTRRGCEVRPGPPLTQNENRESR